jgi:hypothetical protein
VSASRKALAAGLLFAAGFAYARFWWGPGPEALERQRREVERLGERLERRLREQSRLRDGHESVLVGVPAGVAERLVGEALAGFGSGIRITLRDLKFRKTDEVRAQLLLGRRMVGRFVLNVQVHEVGAVLRPGQPKLRFGRDRVGVELPVAVEDGAGRATLRFRWDGKGVAGAVCGDVDVTREVKARVPRHAQSLAGALSLDVDRTVVVARPEFGDLQLTLPIEPDAEAWRFVESLIDERGALCRTALRRADIPDKLRATLARGIRVTVPRRLIERPLRLPLSVDRGVTLPGRTLELAARPTDVMLTSGRLWYGVSVSLRQREEPEPVREEEAREPIRGDEALEPLREGGGPPL